MIKIKQKSLHIYVFSEKKIPKKYFVYKKKLEIEFSEPTVIISTFKPDIIKMASEKL